MVNDIRKAMQILYFVQLVGMITKRLSLTETQNKQAWEI